MNVIWAPQVPGHLEEMVAACTDGSQDDPGMVTRNPQILGYRGGCVY